MNKKTALFLPSFLFSTYVLAMPAEPGDLIKTFLKSSALEQLLDKNPGVETIVVEVVAKPSPVIKEELCHNYSRSGSIVGVSLTVGRNTRCFYFSTPERPEDLKHCAD